MIQLVGRVAQGSLQVLGLKFREIRQDLLAAQACGIELKNVNDADPHPADAGLAAALLRVGGDSITHACTLGALDGSVDDIG